MLHMYSFSPGTVGSTELPDSPLPDDLVWIDNLNGTESEVGAVEKATGLSVPSLKSLREIEHSSRMRRDGEAIVLSLPLPQAGTQGTALAPVGFMLTRDRLVTVRFDPQATFDDFIRGLEKSRPSDVSAPSIMIGLFETIVDALADRLEEIGDGLDDLATRIFGQDAHDPRGQRSPKLKNATLRELMRRAGRTGQILGKLRASLLTAGRIVPYVESEGKEWFKEGVPARMATLKADIASLDEYEAHLSDKVQFLLDAALGLINMDQNDPSKC